MARETRLSLDDLMMPLVIEDGTGRRTPIAAMPGQFRYSPDRAAEKARALYDLGIPAVLLIGLPNHRDALGTQAYQKNGVVQKAVRDIKKAVPDLMVVTDVCLCAFTDHGHCGMIVDGDVDNDQTLDLLGRMALSHVRAGADMVAPSDMMDGRVGFIREVLDENEFDHIPIMSSSAKYASSFYVPFQEVAGGVAQRSDRQTYQMDPSNVREALREVGQDVSEGADIVMVKPALAYLDVLSLVREETDLPLAAYNVSGEYSMVKAAAERGFIDGERAMMEMLTAIKRAGADIIITHFAEEAAPLVTAPRGWRR